MIRPYVIVASFRGYSAYQPYHTSAPDMVDSIPRRDTNQSTVAVFTMPAQPLKENELLIYCL